MLRCPARFRQNINGVHGGFAQTGEPDAVILLRSVTAAALAIVLLSGCASNVVPVMPKPSDALMADCPAPSLIPDAENQTAVEINEERLEVAKYAVCNRDKFHGLRDFWRGMK